MKKLLFIAIMLLLSGMLSGCNLLEERINGDGNIETASVDLDDNEVYRFEVENLKTEDCTIRISFVSELGPKVSVSTDKNILESVKLTASGNKIRIAGSVFNKYLPTDFTIQIGVAVNFFDLNGAFDLDYQPIHDVSSLEFVVNGVISGNVNADTIEGSLKAKVRGVCTLMFMDIANNSVSFDCDGTSTVTLEGTTDDLVIKMEGVCTLNSLNLVSQNADVDVNGVSFISVNAVEMLKVNADGTGSIVYSGDPQIESQLDGMMSLTKK